MADTTITTEVSEPRRSKIEGARDFVVDARAEMDKVSWPPRPELITSTRAVVIGALLLGILIGAVDYILQLILVRGVASLAG